MCFEFDALPPRVPEDRIVPLLAGGAGAERLTLESADGTPFGAALAECPDPIGGPAVIILPDVRGMLDPGRAGVESADFPAPLRSADDIRTPVLALFGGADQLIPPEDIEAFDAALTRNAVPHEIHSYPVAPHSFFDRSFDEHAEASADAWRRVLDFLGRVGAGAAA